MRRYRRKTDGTEDVKKVMNQNCTSLRSVGVNMHSCLKKPHTETTGSIINGRRGDSVSTGLDSLNEKTVTTWGSSSAPKKVRFDTVEIRSYERIASDNPCCSSGPPIG